MKCPPSRLTAVLPGGMTCGIDWVNDDCALCGVHAAGRIVQQIKALYIQLAEQRGLHADTRIFTYLPWSGTVRTARLLVKVGDGRAWIRTPETLACPVGVASSIHKSGNITHVDYR